MPERRSFDVVIVGGGHNALVAATLLGRAGRSVLVLERRDELGGAAVSARAVPGLRRAAVALLLPGQPVPGRARCARSAFTSRLRTRRVAAYPPIEPDPSLAEPCWPGSPSGSSPRSPSRFARARTCAGSSATTTPGTRCSRRRCPSLLERTFDSRPRAGHGPHRRADRDVRARRRPGAPPEPLLPLPRRRAGSWDVPVGGMGALSARWPTPRAGAGAELVTRRRGGRDRHRRRERRGRRAPTAGLSRRGTCWPASPRTC